MKIAGSIPDFTGGLERALFAPKTSPRHYAAAIRIKDAVQFSYFNSSRIFGPAMTFLCAAWI